MLKYGQETYNFITLKPKVLKILNFEFFCHWNFNKKSQKQIVFMEIGSES
jgi:hypothetical protein